MDSMAVKLIGAVVLTVAGLMIGRALSSACVRRVEALRAFREALVPLEIKMLHETLPLSKALMASRFDVFMALSQALAEGDGAGEAWGIMADKLYAHGGQFDCLGSVDTSQARREAQRAIQRIWMAATKESVRFA